MLSKLFSFLFVLSLSIMALSQSVEIGSPAPNTNVHRGRKLTIQILQPTSIEGSPTIGIAIGISSCKGNPGCVPPTEGMGDVLYHGPFTPKRHPRTQPYQNFTVVIPSSLPKGKAHVNVAYAALWGAAFVPAFDTLNETVHIV